MANYLRTRLHFLIGLAGFLVFCLGIFILASGIKIRNILTGELKLEWFRGYGSNTCQYWAGIPTILTGGALVLTVLIKKCHSSKHISLCCVLITMVLTLGVIIEESIDAANIHGFFKDDSFCHTNFSGSGFSSKVKKDCAKFKEAYHWYYILLFITDIVLVLCSFVMLLLFADWILFVAPKTLRNEQEAHEVPPPHQERCVAMRPTEQYQQTWNSQYDQSAILLHPV